MEKKKVFAKVIIKMVLLKRYVIILMINYTAHLLSIMMIIQSNKRVSMKMDVNKVDLPVIMKMDVYALVLNIKMTYLMELNK